jgi:hypothetical protein
MARTFTLCKECWQEEKWDGGLRIADLVRHGAWGYIARRARREVGRDEYQMTEGRRQRTDDC